MPIVEVSGRKRFRCTPDDPWSVEKNPEKLKVEHSLVEPYGDDIYFDHYRCLSCGHRWKEEVPD